MELKLNHLTLSRLYLLLLVRHLRPTNTSSQSPSPSAEDKMIVQKNRPSQSRFFKNSIGKDKVRYGDALSNQIDD